MAGRKWTKEEEEYLRKNYKFGNVDECAKHLERTNNSIKLKANSLGLRSGYYLTDEEKRILQNSDYLSNQQLAKLLGRSENSAKQLRHHYDIGTMVDSTERMCIAEIARLTGVTEQNVRITWVKSRGLKARRYGKLYKMVSKEELFRFMQENPKLWKASNCETWFFENEEWFDKKRKAEFEEMKHKRWSCIGV